MAKAKTYYALAAEKRHAHGTTNLAYILLQEKRYIEAIEHFYLAKSLGRFENSLANL